MPGKLDEISQAIGALQAGVQSLGDNFEKLEKSLEDNRELQSARHEDNQRALADLKRDLEEHSKAVANRPAFDLSQHKIVALATVGVIALTIVGWVIEMLVKWGVTALLSRAP